VEEQVDPGGEQKHPTHGALDRDQAKDDACARRVAGAHRQSLSSSSVYWRRRRCGWRSSC
jgi:hypothetical protein